MKFVMKKEKHFLKNILIIIMALFIPQLLLTQYTYSELSEFKIIFPLKDLTPYNARIESVLDHSGLFYTRDNIVLAYTGEEGRCENGAKEYMSGKFFNKETKQLEKTCNNPKRKGIWGYLKEDGSSFLIPGQDNILWYDGHSGYDYPKVLGVKITEIFDPAKGTLCIATLKTIKPKNGKILWRDRNKCVYGNDPVNDINRKENSWDKWHTFYILHNIDDYTTWYLHSNDLEESVKKEILEKGYSEVSEGQKIAFVGHKGLKGGDHLHFEVRKGDRGVVDPYGWEREGQPVLWRDNNTPLEPTITSSLEIIQPPPYRVNNTITAEFTITNKATTTITFDVLTVGGRDPDDQVADFEWHRNITLKPGDSYPYKGNLTLTKSGNYHFFCAYRTLDGNWNTGIPTEDGVENTIDITVNKSFPDPIEF